MKYRKKPVEIEAIQFNGFNPKEIAEFVGENCELDYYTSAYEAGQGGVKVKITIHTLEGDMNVSKGDYVIKGVNGEFYPCKPDIFEKTYDKIC